LISDPHLTQSIAMLEALRAESDLALTYAGLGRLRAKQGKIAEARGHFARAFGIFERLGTLMGPERVCAELNALPAA
jgi:hypothetical protein